MRRPFLRFFGRARKGKQCQQAPPYLALRQRRATTYLLGFLHVRAARLRGRDGSPVAGEAGAKGETPAVRPQIIR